ncbi:hypothetical protein EJ110_NYTH36753 [Nymphaea thermarum]|nr:hypothetical protein EJ110_NYTH36753 [Nymphaea thermarum]
MPRGQISFVGILLLYGAVSCGLRLYNWTFMHLFSIPGSAMMDLTVPKGTMLPLSSVNVAFDQELIGPALFSGLVLAGQRKVRHETVEDLWCGMCVKVEIQMKRTMEGTSLIEMAVLFFQSVKLPQSSVTTEECFVEMAKLVSEELGCADPSFAQAPDAMEEWVRV